MKPARRMKFNGVHYPIAVSPEVEPQERPPKQLESPIEGSKGKNKGGRPSVYDRMEYPRMAFVASSAMGATLVDLAELFNVAPDTITQWMKDHAGFSLAIKTGRDVWDSERAEKALKTRVMGFDYTEEKIEEIINVKELQYGEGWSAALKTEIKKRDNWSCQNPKCKSEAKGGKRDELDVHHVDYSKANSHPKNLITLCKECHGSCHGKGNASKRYWINYYKPLMEAKAMDLTSTRLVPLIKRTVITKKVLPDVVAAMFWLQNRAPHRWKNVKYIGIKADTGHKDFLPQEDKMDLNTIGKEDKLNLERIITGAIADSTDDR